MLFPTCSSLQANAEFIRLADNYKLVQGGSNNHNYANVDLILDIANQIPVQVCVCVCVCVCVRTRVCVCYNMYIFFLLVGCMGWLGSC